MSALKKKSETCNEQLERMVKNIAEDITDGLNCLLYTSPSTRD